MISFSSSILPTVEEPELDASSILSVSDKSFSVALQYISLLYRLLHMVIALLLADRTSALIFVVFVRVWVNDTSVDGRRETVLLVVASLLASILLPAIEELLPVVLFIIAESCADRLRANARRDWTQRHHSSYKMTSINKAFHFRHKQKQYHVSAKARSECNLLKMKFTALS